MFHGNSDFFQFSVDKQIGDAWGIGAGSQYYKMQDHLYTTFVNSLSGSYSLKMFNSYYANFGVEAIFDYLKLTIPADYFNPEPRIKLYLTPRINFGVLIHNRNKNSGFQPWMGFSYTTAITDNLINSSRRGNHPQINMMAGADIGLKQNHSLSVDTYYSGIYSIKVFQMAGRLNLRARSFLVSPGLGLKFSRMELYEIDHVMLSVNLGYKSVRVAAELYKPVRSTLRQFNYNFCQFGISYQLPVKAK